MSFNEVAAPRGSETILIVDPDPETRKLAAFMLAKQGYTVLESRDRTEALARLAESGGGVQMLLLDSRGRGCELADSMRRSDPRLQVLFLCRQSGPGYQLVVKSQLPFIKKPFTMHEIAGKVREVLDSGVKVMRAGDSF